MKSRFKVRIHRVLSTFDNSYDLEYMVNDRWYLSGIVFKSVADVEDMRDVLNSFLESKNRLK